MENIEIEIKNFRSIGHIRFPISTVTQLIGRNNSGKSNIMLAIDKSLNQTPKERIFTENDVPKHNKNALFELSMYFDGKIAFSGKARVNEKFQWDDSLEPDMEPIYLKAFPDINDAQSNTSTTPLGKLLLELKEESEGKFNDLEREFLKIIEAIKKLDNEVNSNLRTNILQSFSKIDANVLGINFSPNNIVSIEDFLKKRIPIFNYKGMDFQWTEMGHGTQRLLLILLYKEMIKYMKDKKSKKKKILLLEEPEIFMHPHQQRVVSEFIYKDIIEQNDHCKIIVSTHSPFFIDHENLGNLKIIYKDSNNITSIINPNPALAKYNKSNENLKNDKDLRKLLSAFNIDPASKEIFFAEKVILVEGHNEKMCLPSLLRIYKGLNINASNISTYNCASNKSILPYARILDDFSIPYIVCLDDDTKYSPDGDVLEQNPVTKSIIKNLSEYLKTRVNDTLAIIKGDFCSAFTSNGQKEAFEILREIEINDENPIKLNDNLNEYLDRISLLLNN